MLQKDSRIEVLQKVSRIYSKNKPRHNKNSLIKFYLKWFKYNQLKLYSLLKNPSFCSSSHSPLLAEANIESGDTPLNRTFITFTC